MDWTDFAQRLTRELMYLPVDAYVLVQGPGGLPYAQAMRHRNGLYAEAVGSDYLPEPLGSREERLLKVLGWHAPDGRKHRNWWCRVALPPEPTDITPEQAAECRALADRMAGAFQDAYGDVTVTDLTYEAYQNGHEASPIPMPGLGIPPVNDEPAQPAPLAWTAFTERLARELAAMEPELALVISHRQRDSHYVQAFRDTGGTRAEAVSGRALPPRAPRLDAREDELLTQAGWNPPGKHPNWTYDLPETTDPDDYRDLAAMMVTALRDVQLARAAADLVYEAFIGASYIELTEFGIPAATPSRVDTRRASPPLPGPTAPDPFTTPRTTKAARPPSDAASPPPVTAPEPERAARTPATDPQTTGDAAPSLTPSSAGNVPAKSKHPSRTVADAPSGPNRSAQATPDKRTSAPPAKAPARSGHPSPPPTTAPPAKGTELEEELVSAKSRGDQPGYLGLILRTELFVPVTEGEHHITRDYPDGTYLLAFTSPEAMDRALGGRLMDYRRTTFIELAANWPNPDWQLAINTKLPNSAYIDTGTIQRTAERLRGQPIAPGRALADTPISRRPQSTSTASDTPPRADTDAGPPFRPTEHPPANAASPIGTPTTGKKPVTSAPAESVRPATGKPAAGAHPETASPSAESTVHAVYGGTPVADGPPGAASPPSEPPAGGKPTADARPRAESPPATGSAPAAHPASDKPAVDAHPPAEPPPNKAPDHTPSGDTPPAGAAHGAASPSAGRASDRAVAGARSGAEPSSGGPGGDMPVAGAVADATSASAGDVSSGAGLGGVTGAAVGDQLAGGSFEIGRGAVVQKVVRPDHVAHYLNGGYDWVAGPVYRVRDVSDLRTPERLVRGLGLGYAGSPYSPEAGEVHVIRWAVVKPGLMERGAAAGGSSVPAFRIGSQRLPHGAEMFRLDRQGTETFVAVYDADTRSWLLTAEAEAGG